MYRFNIVGFSWTGKWCFVWEYAILICGVQYQVEAYRAVVWVVSYYTVPCYGTIIAYSNMTSFKCVVKIIYTYTHCNLWRHRQFITIFYRFLHIRIEIIHGSHMYILFLPRVGLYVSFLPLAYARGKTLWHKGLPVVKTIYTYGFHELFLNYTSVTSDHLVDTNSVLYYDFLQLTWDKFMNVYVSEYRTNDNDLWYCIVLCFSMWCN
jgi:hypothetical protein